MTGKMANRADLIIKILMAQSGASIKELSEHLGVSEITIRRDLHVLEQQGRLRLINGVAVYRAPAETVSVYPEYDLAYEYTIFQQKKALMETAKLTHTDTEHSLKFHQQTKDLENASTQSSAHSALQELGTWLQRKQLDLTSTNLNTMMLLYS